MKEYLNKFYFPGAKNKLDCCENDFIKIKELVNWKKKVRANWNSVRVEDIKCSCNDEVKIGQKVKVQAKVFLGELNPEDVSVEIFYGKLNGSDSLESGNVTEMRAKKKNDSYYDYEGEIPNEITGLKGYTIRVLPKHLLFTNKFEMGLIYWVQ
jgi:starch phosphorylase